MHNTQKKLPKLYTLKSFPKTRVESKLYLFNNKNQAESSRFQLYTCFQDATTQKIYFYCINQGLPN